MTTLQRFPFVALFASLVLLAVDASSAQEGPPKVPPIAARPAPDIVLRMSLELFDDLTTDEFERELPVDRVVNGIRAVGVAEVQGRVSVELEADGDDAFFLVKLAGQAHSNTVAHRRPIQAHGTGETTFLAEKQIHFNGVKFQSATTEAEVEYESNIERVTTKLPGVLGRVVKRIAWRRIPTMQPETEKIAAADTRADIIAEFDQIADQLIDELNESTRLQQTIHMLYPETKSWRYYLSTTPTYLQAAAGPPDCGPPTLPPGADDVTDAPVEIWVRKTPTQELFEAAVDCWDEAHDELREHLPDATDQETTLVDGAQVIRVGQWKVIAVGETMVEQATRTRQVLKASSNTTK